MGTHARLTDGTNSAYVHYDGMPDHMLPELRNILEAGGAQAIDILLAHDWSYIDSDQGDNDRPPSAAKQGFGGYYTDGKLSNDAVRNNAGQHVYLLDRTTLTVTYI